jgi:tetratricopeptide (TPR) repeat protein
MRALLYGGCGAILLVVAGARLAAQLPPPTELQRIQQISEEFAREKAEELALLAASNTGLLHPSAEASFRRMGEAVRLWKRERDSGAAPLLAEGVLLDCLSRLAGVAVRRPLPGEPALPVATNYPAQRQKAATRAFDAALRLQPDLIEARMRRARLRAAGDSSAAGELETIAADATAMPFSYLAAVSRAALAHRQGDDADAIRWYERALELNPRSTAATIALRALKPATTLSFDTLDADDLYYSYPCMVLTPRVAAALADRVQRVVMK